MLKIEVSFTDNHLLKKLLDYAIAADIQPHQLIEEIIFDAMHGNDIKGSLEDTLKKGFTQWKQEDIYIPKDTTKGYPGEFAVKQAEGRTACVEMGGSYPQHQCHQTSGGVVSKFRSIHSDHRDDLQRGFGAQLSSPDLSAAKAVVTSNAVVSPVHEDTLQNKPLPALMQPRMQIESDAAASSSNALDVTKIEALASKFGKAVTISPDRKAAELLKPQEEESSQGVVAADVMYLSWLDDAVNAIKALPQGRKFVANQFLPKQATPEEARVFGKKLLQLITKYKLFSSKHKGKACMEYVKA